MGWGPHRQGVGVTALPVWLGMGFQSKSQTGVGAGGWPGLNLGQALPTGAAWEPVWLARSCLNQSQQAWVMGLATWESPTTKSQPPPPTTGGQGLNHPITQQCCWEEQNTAMSTRYRWGSPKQTQLPACLASDKANCSRMGSVPG